MLLEVGRDRDYNTLFFVVRLQGPVTVDELLEVGRAKLMNHDLALGMARLSEASEVLASEKQVLALVVVWLWPVFAVLVQ